MRQYIFEKRQIKLKEDEITINSTNVNNSSQQSVGASVTPTDSNKTPNLNQDLNNTYNKAPNASSLDVNLSAYSDKNSAVAPTIANINAKSPSDASQTIKQAINTNPALKTAVNNGNAIAKVHIQNGSQMQNTNESILFTKKELDNFLSKL